MGTDSTRLLVCGVSTIVSTTSSSASSVAPVPLFLPWITIVVVAKRFPEAGLVLIAELEPPNPLGALPEVEVRHEEAGRAAMLAASGSSS